MLKYMDWEELFKQITPSSIVPDQVNYWKRTPDFFISLMKSFWGDNATAANEWGYHWLPKWDKSYDIMAQTQMMVDGKMNGYIVQGFNPLAAFPDKNKCSVALSKLKYLVIIDPLVTESSKWEECC